MHTITINIEDDSDFELITGLIERLGLPVIQQQPEKTSDLEKEALKMLYGSWKGDESGDELAATIHQARADTIRDVQL